VAKQEWGAKRVCQSCGSKFYDLHRDPIVCPVCGATYHPGVEARPRRSRAAAPAKAAPVAAAVDEYEEEPAQDLEETDEVLAGADEVVSDEEDVEEDVDEEEAAEAEADDELPDVEEDEEAKDLIEDPSELGEDDMDEVIDGVDNDEER
jgi:uncharacterized protein (TIGR02300 family)